MLNLSSFQHSDAPHPSNRSHTGWASVCRPVTGMCSLSPLLLSNIFLMHGCLSVYVALSLSLSFSFLTSLFFAFLYQMAAPSSTETQGNLPEFSLSISICTQIRSESRSTFWFMALIEQVYIYKQQNKHRKFDSSMLWLALGIAVYYMSRGKCEEHSKRVWPWNEILER